MRSRKTIGWKQVSTILIVLCAVLCTCLLFNVGWILPDNAIQTVVLALGYIVLISAVLEYVSAIIVRKNKENSDYE